MLDGRDAWLGAISAAFAACIVGGSVAVSALLTEYPVYAGQALRYFTAALILGVAVRVNRRWVRPTLRELFRMTLLAGGGLVVFNVAVVLALQRTEPAALGVVIGASPLILALLGPVMARRRISGWLLLSAVAVVAGAVIVQGAANPSWEGLGFSLLALAGEVSFSLLAVSLLPRHGALNLSFLLCFLASTMLSSLAVASGSGEAFRLPSSSEFWALSYLAVFVTAIAFVAWYSGVQRLGVERAGLLVGLIPITTLIVSCALGTEAMTLAKLVGVLVVGGGIALGLTASASAPSKARAGWGPCRG